MGAYQGDTAGTSALRTSISAHVAVPYAEYLLFEGRVLQKSPERAIVARGPFLCKPHHQKSTFRARRVMDGWLACLASCLTADAVMCWVSRKPCSSMRSANRLPAFACW